MRNVLFLLLLLTGCFSSQKADMSVDRNPSPWAVNHIVLIELQDPSLADALIAACDAQIASISVVRGYYCGKHMPSGRVSVRTDYDVGLYVGFASLEAYKTYVDHPQHISFVKEWKPRLKELRVYDISGQ